jgi:hypothetical protein
VATTPSATASIRWRVATVESVRNETPTAKTFRLRLPEVSTHLAGQHEIVRLTAPDGYTAVRSYSIASPPDGSDVIELTVELLPDGEVSEFLHREVRPGDELEVRGPIGGWFIWRGDTPALLIGGGSGVVPLMAMLRLARRNKSADLLRLLVSSTAWIGSTTRTNCQVRKRRSFTPPLHRPEPLDPSGASTVVIFRLSPIARSSTSVARNDSPKRLPIWFSPRVSRRTGSG